MDSGQVKVDKQGRLQPIGYRRALSSELRLDSVEQAAPKPVILAFPEHGSTLHVAFVGPEGFGRIAIGSKHAGTEGGGILVHTPPRSGGRIYINKGCIGFIVA